MGGDEEICEELVQEVARLRLGSGELDGLRLALVMHFRKKTDEKRTFNIVRCTASFAIHHAYILAKFSILVTIFGDVLNSGTSSSARPCISGPPTLVSPRLRRKSHRQNCSVIL